jgi:hypothetical protein
MGPPSHVQVSPRTGLVSRTLFGQRAGRICSLVPLIDVKHDRQKNETNKGGARKQDQWRHRQHDGDKGDENHEFPDLELKWFGSVLVCGTGVIAIPHSRNHSRIAAKSAWQSRGGIVAAGHVRPNNCPTSLSAPTTTRGAEHCERAIGQPTYYQPAGSLTACPRAPQSALSLTNEHMFVHPRLAGPIAL